MICEKPQVKLDKDTSSASLVNFGDKSSQISPVVKGEESHESIVEVNVDELDTSAVVSSIRQLTVYEAAYKHPHKTFEYPAYTSLLNSDESPQVTKLEFNANHSLRGLQARFSDSSVSPFFGTPNAQLHPLFVKQGRFVTSKILIHSSYDGYLRMIELKDGKNFSFAQLGE